MKLTKVKFPFCDTSKTSSYFSISTLNFQTLEELLKVFPLKLQ
eukprot:14206.XXX_549330_549458_1 [CDS] Oithona nana genome sequencing.